NLETRNQNSLVLFSGFLDLKFLPYGLHRAMSRDFPHRFLEQLASGRNLVPGRGAARMRQRDQIEGERPAFDDELPADDGVQFVENDKLSNGEFAHRNNERWAQNLQLVIHPSRAIADLLRAWHTISAAGRFARKT